MSINIFPLIFDSILIMLAVFALVFSRDSRLSQKTRRALLFLGLGLCLLIICLSWHLLQHPTFFQ